MSHSPILLSADAIQLRVRALAAALDEDREGSDPIHLIGALRGALIFLADLARAMATPVTLDVLTVSSYDGTRKQAHEPRLVHDPRAPIEGRDVVLVEDIVDTGHTLRFVRRHLQAARPRRFRCVTLLDKPARRLVDVAADYVGFTIPDRFVIGYGLDYQERYRNLPYITEIPMREEDPALEG
jgi:hypoxanthine phosphoribosyltransferase